MNLERDLIALDLEATGTWKDKDRIIELGMIKLSKDGVETKYSTYVNPQMSIPEAVVKITGINDEMVKDAPIFTDIAPDVYSFMQGCDLAGYNIKRFDLPMLNRQLGENGLHLDISNAFVYDAEEIYKINFKRDLTAAYLEYCGQELVGAHGALPDAKASLAILQRQMFCHGDGTLSSLKNIVYASSAEFFDVERKFRWWNGELYITFGKHNAKTIIQIIKEDRKYAQWILTADFSLRVKNMIRDALNGVYPRQ